MTSIRSKAVLFRASLPTFLIAAAALAGGAYAEQGSSVTVSNQTASTNTNPTQTRSKQWKDQMLQKQLDVNPLKSMGINSGSLNGFAVRPTPSTAGSQSAEKKRKKEFQDQAQFFLMMNPNDSSAESPFRNPFKSQEWDKDSRTANSPLEELYLQQLQRERSGTTNRVKGGPDVRNDSDSFTSSYEPINRSSMPGQTNSFMQNIFKADAGSSARNSSFSDLFRPSTLSDAQVQAQDNHRDQFRQLLDSHAPGTGPSASWNSGNPLSSQSDVSRGSSGFGKMLDPFNSSLAPIPAPANNFRLPSSASVGPGFSLPSKPASPAYQAPERPHVSPLMDTIPRRKF